MSKTKGRNLYGSMFLGYSGTDINQFLDVPFWDCFHQRDLSKTRYEIAPKDHFVTMHQNKKLEYVPLICLKVTAYPKLTHSKVEFVKLNHTLKS